MNIDYTVLCQQKMAVSRILLPWHKKLQAITLTSSAHFIQHQSPLSASFIRGSSCWVNYLFIRIISPSRACVDSARADSAELESKKMDQDPWTVEVSNTVAFTPFRLAIVQCCITLRILTYNSLSKKKFLVGEEI